MTPEQFKDRAQAEAVFAEMRKNGMEPSVDGLRGTLLMAVQMAYALKLSEADLRGLAGEEFCNWKEYLDVKAKVLARRKEKK